MVQEWVEGVSGRQRGADLAVSRDLSPFLVEIAVSHQPLEMAARGLSRAYRAERRCCAREDDGEWVGGGRARSRSACAEEPAMRDWRKHRRHALRPNRAREREEVNKPDWLLEASEPVGDAVSRDHGSSYCEVGRRPF